MCGFSWEGPRPDVISIGGGVFCLFVCGIFVVCLFLVGVGSCFFVLGLVCFDGCVAEEEFCCCLFVVCVCVCVCVLGGWGRELLL